jgi:cellulose biosynthesis protein BcsQ
MKIIAVYNLKGGVGKTASAVNLGYLCAKAGYRTLIWDLDPQGAASFYFRIKPKIKGGTDGLLKGKKDLDDLIKGTDFNNLDLLPADFSYRYLDIGLSSTSQPTQQLQKKLKPLAQNYDVLFLDCPPSISLLSENIFCAAEALLIPVIPTTLSLRTLQQLRQFCKQESLKHLRLMPFFSMVDRRKNLHKEIIESLPKDYKGLLRIEIPYASVIEQMGLQRAPVASYAPDSTAAQAYEKLWQVLRKGFNL